MIKSIGTDRFCWYENGVFFSRYIVPVFLSMEDAANTRWFHLICIVLLCKSKENTLTFVASLAASPLGVQETTIKKVDGSYISDIFTKS